MPSELEGVGTVYCMYYNMCFGIAAAACSPYRRILRLYYKVQPYAYRKMA